jgi:hypothetical protein
MTRKTKAKLAVASFGLLVFGTYGYVGFMQFGLKALAFLGVVAVVVGLFAWGMVVLVNE